MGTLGILSAKMEGCQQDWRSSSGEEYTTFGHKMQKVSVIYLTLSVMIQIRKQYFFGYFNLWLEN